MILVIPITVVFVPDALQVHYGAHHLTNASMFVGKMPFIHHLLRPVSASLDTALKTEFASNVQSTISFQMDSALHAQLIQFILLLKKAVIVFLDFTLIKMAFALKNVELIKFMTPLLKIVPALRVWAKLMEFVKFVPQVQVPLLMVQDALLAVTMKA